MLLFSSSFTRVYQLPGLPSAITEDLDAWFEELFDPNFDGSIVTNITDLPASIEQKSELQTGLSTLIHKDKPLDFGILTEEIIGILHDDFTAMPEITELPTVDRNSALSPNHQIKFGTEDFKREMPVPSDNAKFTGIQIRDRRLKLSTTASSLKFRPARWNQGTAHLFAKPSNLHMLITASVQIASLSSHQSWK